MERCGQFCICYFIYIWLIAVFNIVYVYDIYQYIGVSRIWFFICIRLMSFSACSAPKSPVVLFCYIGVNEDSE